MKFKNVFNGFVILFFSFVCIACTPVSDTLLILHTNDTHSQVEPIAMGKRDGNNAGYARRMGIIQHKRNINPDIILLDAGDFCQGTPYFNFYHGRIEVDALNRMGYDAITLGNHEFDYGVDTLAKVLQNATFAVVSANYDVQGTPLENIVQPYVVLHRAGIRVGIVGVGINPKGLIADKNFAPVRYLEPITSVQRAVNELKDIHDCEVVICLSHLGTGDDDGHMSDVLLAKSTRNIDVIIGAHTHKVVTNKYIENLDSQPVLLAQMGKSGARIGEILLKLGE